MMFEDEVVKIPNCNFFRDHDLTSLTTMRFPSRGDLINVNSLEALKKVLHLLKKSNRNYQVVGWGANQILPAVCEDVIIHLNLPFDFSYLDTPRQIYTLPASLGLNHLTSHAVKFGLNGWEVFTGIPASLGGAVYMNAGTSLGEIGKLVKSVKLITPDGEERLENISSKSFSYRKNHFVSQGEVIVEINLIHSGFNPEISNKIKDYLQYRKKTQPLATKNCGCVFKNPMPDQSAGKLIDLMGLKGVAIGGLRISEKHANFIENYNHANWDQFQTMIKTIKEYIDHFYGIEFELEVKIPYH